MRRFLAVLAVLCGSALPAAAQDVETGAVLFSRHCATCHGAEARGDGPMAEVLTILPADLTGLAARNDGVFPRARVVARINGDVLLLGHGGPMPVFFEILDGDGAVLDAEDGSPILTSRPLADIVTYLESVQR